MADDITLDTSDTALVADIDVVEHPDTDLQDEQVAREVLALLQGLGSNALAVSTGGASALVPQLLNALGNATGQDLALGTGADVGGLRQENADFLRLQLAVQREMQVFTARSNVSKTLHESAMAAVRNIKA